MIGTEADLDTLDFGRSDGVVTVVAQDVDSGAVLMVAHADRSALLRTLATGEMHYTSRTRGLWHKGATSGNVQRVVALHADCDGDAVLALVEPAGPACHTGTTSCFSEATAAPALLRLDRIVADRAGQPGVGESYTRRLLADRNLRIRKIGEESAELVQACCGESAERVVEESADLLYHVLVTLRAAGRGLADLARVLRGRQHSR